MALRPEMGWMSMTMMDNPMGIPKWIFCGGGDGPVLFLVAY
jgi:hypothetical protein